jgi:repressor LexA
MSDLGNKEIFSKNLRRYMKINNKDRNDVSRDLTIPYSTLTDWYNGNIYPRIDKIQLLANYFGIQKADLVENNSDINKSIPILGTVKAGYDWLAEENVIGYITDENTVKGYEKNIQEYYALKVIGDSMLPLLSEGDLVIVHDQDDVESGQTAVVLINGEEATVKKVVKTNEGIELHAMNPYYPVKKFTFDDMKNIPVKIIGRVKEAKIKGAFE